MRKRIISLLLAFVLIISVVPVSALAAVRELLGNSAAENQTILNELSALTGGSSAEAAAVLEKYGLLDENGQLNVDETVNLDGEDLTLSEVMDLLSDPATDLTEVGYVDGTPIALGDLKTIIEIEQELARIQETYFSDRTFSGEAVSNLNSLLDQMETSGISLMRDTTALSSQSGYIPLDLQLTLDDSGSNTISSEPFSLSSGREVSFTATLKAQLLSTYLNSVSVYLGNASGTTYGSKITLSSTAPSQTLSYTPTTDLADVRLYVEVSTQGADDSSIQVNGKAIYGNQTAVVEFTNASGVVFENAGGQLGDASTVTLVRDIGLPNLSSSIRDSSPAGFRGENVMPLDYNQGIDINLSEEVLVQPMEALVQRLYDAKANKEGFVANYSLNLMMNQSNSNYASLFYSAVNGNATTVGYQVVIPTPADIQITGISRIDQSNYWGPELEPAQTQYMQEGTQYPLTITTQDTEYPFEVMDSIKLTYINTFGGSGSDPVPVAWISIDFNYQTITLSNDGNNPVCTSITAAAGTYRTGQRIPVVLEFDELVKVNDSGAVMNINGHDFTAAELRMQSTAGNRILFWYPVQQVDTAELSITSANGITDVFGNRTSINQKISGVTLQSLVLRFAPTALNASAYDPETGVTFSLEVNAAYDNLIANYDGGLTAPFRVLVNDGTETHTLPVTITEEETFVTAPLMIERKQEEATYQATLQVNEGSKDTPNWVDAFWLGASFTVPAYVNVDSVEVTADDPDVTVLPLDAQAFPTLTAAVKGADDMIPTATTGSWTSSDEEIATLLPVDGTPLQVIVQPTGQKLGEVTFTFTADNGTPEDETDDKADSVTYTVTAGDNLSLSIPSNTATIVARKNAAATVLWISNAKEFAADEQGNPVDFDFTVALYEGNFTTEAALEGQQPVATYTADKEKNGYEIPANVLETLSVNNEPAYTVLVSMPHPNASSSEVRLTAMAWIVVQPVPAKAVLTRPENTYLLDTVGSINIPWAVENRDSAATGQNVTLTVIRVQEDNTSTTVYQQSPGSSTNGSVSLPISLVKDDYLKDTYQIMLTVDNPGDAPSTDSYPLYVYNGDALKLQDSEGNDLPATLTMDNTAKVSGTLPTTTSEILALRQELGLIEYVNINYKDFDWNTYRDGIKWETSDDSIVSVNYKQGGLYENIKVFGYETNLPRDTMALSSTADGKAVITATHAKTGMSDSVEVDVTTLREKFYLFQFSPAMKTTVQYIDGQGTEKTVQSNDDGVLALYEPDGIASDVWLSAGSVYNTLYLGTIYHSNLQSGERDTTMLQLYPLNSFKLQAAAQVKVILHKPNGDPLADTTVTIRGGAYKNGHYCEAAQLGPNGTSLENGSVGQTYTTDRYGRAMVYFDATQFWSAENGENENTEFLATDQMVYILEISDIDGNRYYPQFCSMNGNLGEDEWMRTAGQVITLEEVPEGGANKPFVARQVVDYGLDNGRTIDVRKSTGKAGPTKTYPTATLKTTMFLWGEDASAAGSYQLRMADENGYVPGSQTGSVTQYPFSSIPVAENSMTLSADTMTNSGWIADGKDMGIKTRLTKNGSLVQELTMPFRIMDLTRVTPVNEDENVTQMLVTLQSSSNVAGANFSSAAGGNSVMQGITGVLNKISGPVNSNVFKMIITPSDDPTVFSALIWAGYDSLDLNDVDYDQNGISFEADYLNQELEVGVPGVGDLASMAQGTYNPAQTLRENAAKVTSADADLNLQLTGYYEAEIRYSLANQQWEIYTTGGGFTAGVGMEIGFTANAMVGPVPVTGSFRVGGALQLDFKTAVRYSQQGNNVWSDPDAAAVSDYLTNLRINAYVKAFGGFGFDFAVVALKIGVYGELSIDSQNKFLSRTYLADSNARQLNGQGLNASGEVGIKFVAKFLFISYEARLASAGFSATQKFNSWDTIENYWSSATSGLSANTLQLMAAQNGLTLSSASATLQSRDYLETFARSWGQPQVRIALFSLDEPSALQSLQSNANPDSYPELSDDGQIFAYISDSESQSIYESRAHYSVLTNGSYAVSSAIADPGAGTDNVFTGFGDSGVDIAGDTSFAAAAWVRLSSDLPGKDEGDAVSVEEQNLLMNGAEIVASIYQDGAWTSTRITANGTPDLAPVVASNGDGKAVVFWRSVYNADPNDPLDFRTKDTIYYSVYDETGWSAAQPLYNGSNGSVKALEAAMLPDGTAMAVYTLDKSEEGNTTTYEVGYTMVSSDGDLGNAMLVTSDSYLDENPQVVTAHFGTADGSDRFVLAWHSLRDGLSDIQLLAVDKNGVMSNSFPASLAEITMDGSAAVGSTFRLATLSGNYRDVTNLTILWSETVDNDHSVLRAARLRSNGDTGYVLSAPMELATLPSRTMAEHFAAYVSNSNQIKAIIQATQYGATMDDPDQTFLYTATSHFATDAVEVESIGVDYENLTLNSLTPVQFVVRNTGLNNVETLTVKMDDGETATLNTTLLPNQSATLIVYHKIGETVEDASYTITASNGIYQSGTVYFDYPDLGISRMEVMAEQEGRRTIGMTLFNAAAATLAGNKNRDVKLAFYLDDQHTQAANITCTTAGVSVSGNVLTISDPDALARIDDGSFSLEVTYDLGGYVKAQGYDEVPAGGVYLYADLWTEGKMGTQTEKARMPEYYSSDNLGSLLLTGAYARTGKKSTLTVDLSAGENGNTAAAITLKNNSLQTYTGEKQMATLLSASGEVLETKALTIPTNLNGETSYTETVQFSKQGARVLLTTLVEGEDQLTFDGLPVTLDDFVPATDANGNEIANTYTYELSGLDLDNLVVTAYSGTGGAVTVNGEAVENGTATSVRINPPETTITVVIGENTYILRLTHIPAEPAGTGSYRITVHPSDNGTVTPSRTTAGAGHTVTLTVTPDEGYRLEKLTVTDSRGTELHLVDQGEGRYSFTMPASNVTVEATFVPDDGAGLPFTDVSVGSWYYDAVKYVYENGLMTGTSATLFSPNTTTTRGMIVTILYRLEGSPAVHSSAGFTDVPSGQWYTDAVNWAAANRIVDGYGNGKFGPMDPITREQMAAILYRYANDMGMDVTARADLSVYTDESDISAYAVEAMSWANAEGYITGTTATTLEPQGSATRAQVATILMRYAQKLDQA